MDAMQDVNRRSVLAATAGIVGLALSKDAIAQPQSSPKLQMSDVNKLLSEMKESKSCRLLTRTVDRTKAAAEVNGGFLNNTFFLSVSGKKPYISMKVMLVPLVYTHQPDYWQIEVVGCMSGIVLPAIGLYHETISIDHVRGKKGIEVVWADGSEQIQV